MRHVAFCFDRNYQQHFGASITSLLLNYSGVESDLCIHVFTDAMDDAFAARVKRLQSKYRATIKVHSPSAAIMNRLAGLPLPAHFTSAAYLRIMLAGMLPEEVDRVLYLDADTIVLSDIRELLAADLSGKTLAGVGDYEESEMARYWSISQYINSGVMLMDLRRWREFDYTNKCIAFGLANKDRLKYVDQCAINSVLAGDIKKLPSRWNGFVRPERADGVPEDAAILHYISGSKPWQSWYEHPLGRHYWKFLEVSPWSGSAPEQPRVIAEAVRLARMLTSQGKTKESVMVYENILKSLSKQNGDGSHPANDPRTAQMTTSPGSDA